MGIETVVVFAPADASAPFVAEAGQAVALEGTSAAETYLDVAQLLHAAARTECDAVHPGYGFLAENAGFAQAVVDAGLVWVGPSPEAIASMGDKLAAKKMITAAQVPTLPTIEITDDADVSAAAETIGYPVLIKASAGGGGKGMRIVESEAELADAISGAAREAVAAFGDGTVFIEKYLAAPRHIEIQVLGDQHGNLVHLFERECSIQRRHQKIIEEAPSSALTDAVRTAMGDAALAAAKSVGYYSAGTVEFLLDGDGDDASFYFLEMNTRIQVEHPVTEEITGIDLIREQLLVAQGEPLAFGQDELTITGHAIEARLYAEDPAGGFLPATGTLVDFALPPSPHARFDSGVEAGSVVGVEFDPMLAKVIVHAPTRSEAAARLALVLDRIGLAGVTTNRDFLVATLRTPEFLAGDTTTDFIDRVNPRAVFEPNDEAIVQAMCAAAMFEQVRNRENTRALAFMQSGYRNSSMPAEQARYACGERTFTMHYQPTRQGGFAATLACDGEPVDGPAHVQVAVVDTSRGEIVITCDGRRTRHRVNDVDGNTVVHSPGGVVELTPVSRFPDHDAIDVAGGQVAPMPGKVLAVHVEVGDEVAAGQPLVVMEAMKMEHTITAPGSGVIAELRCAAGDQVDNGQVLVVLADLAE